MKKVALILTGIMLLSFMTLGLLYAQDSNNFSEIMTEGKTLYQAQKYYQALEAFQNAVSMNPGSVAARYNLAMTLKELGLNRQAITEFKRVRELNPNSEEGKAAKTELEALQGKLVSILLLRLGGALKEDEQITFLQLLRDKVRASTPYEVVYLPEKESGPIAVDCQLARDRNTDLVLCGRIIFTSCEKNPQDNTYKYVLKFSASLVEAQFQNHLDYWDETVAATAADKDAARSAAFEQATSLLLDRMRVALGLKYGIDDDPPFMEIATGVPEVNAIAVKMPVEQAKKLPIIVVTSFVDHTGSNGSQVAPATAYLRNCLLYYGKYAVVFEQDFNRFFPYPLTDKDTPAFQKVISRLKADYILLPHIDWLEKQIGGFILGSTAKISGRIDIEVLNPNTGKILNQWEAQKKENAGTYLFKSTEALSKDAFYSDKKFLLLALIDDIRDPLNQFIAMNFRAPGDSASTPASGDQTAPLKRVDPNNPTQPDYGDVSDSILAKGRPNLKAGQEIFQKLKTSLQKDISWDSELYYMALRLSRGKVKNFVNDNFARMHFIYPWICCKGFCPLLRLSRRCR